MWNWTSFGRRCGLLTFALCASMSSVACRVRSNGPHWIETHGGAAVQQIAGGPLGLLAIGTNGLVYSYPEFGSLWHEWNGHLRPRIIAGSRAGLHYVDEDGRVGQAGRWRGGSATRVQAPNVTALATDGDAHSIYAISDGHVMQLLGTGAAPGPCPQIRAVSIAVARGALWVSDVGGVYVGTDATCDPIADSPPNVTRLAGL